MSLSKEHFIGLLGRIHELGPQVNIFFNEKEGVKEWKTVADVVHIGPGGGGYR